MVVRWKHRWPEESDTVRRHQLRILSRELEDIGRRQCLCEVSERVSYIWGTKKRGLTLILCSNCWGITLMRFWKLYWERERKRKHIDINKIQLNDYVHNESPLGTSLLFRIIWLYVMMSPFKSVYIRLNSKLILDLLHSLQIRLVLICLYYK